MILFIAVVVNSVVYLQLKGGGKETSEPEFLTILKCNLAESARAGFQFNCYEIFSDKILIYRHLDHFSGLFKFTEKSLFYH